MTQARGDGMKLLRTKVWKPGDIVLLKWCCIMFGMVFGSFLTGLVKRHRLLFTIAAILLAVKPARDYFSGEEAQQPS